MSKSISLDEALAASSTPAGTVRLITAKVRTTALAEAKEAIVSLRFPVDQLSGRAVHECIALSCDDCAADLLDKAEAKLGKGTVTGESPVEILRDRIATSSRSSEDAQAAEAKRLSEENETWKKYGPVLTVKHVRRARGEAKARRRNRKEVAA